MEQNITKRICVTVLNIGSTISLEIARTCTNRTERENGFKNHDTFNHSSIFSSLFLPCFSSLFLLFTFCIPWSEVPNTYKDKLQVADHKHLQSGIADLQVPIIRNHGACQRLNPFYTITSIQISNLHIQNHFLHPPHHVHHLTSSTEPSLQSLMPEEFLLQMPQHLQITRVAICENPKQSMHGYPNRKFLFFPIKVMKGQK